MKSSLFKEYSRKELERKILLRQLIYILFKTIVTLIIPLYVILILKVQNILLFGLIIGLSGFLYFHFLPYRKVDYSRSIAFLALHLNIIFLVKMMELSKTFGLIEEILCGVLILIWIVKEFYIYKNFKKKVTQRNQFKDDEIKFDSFLLRRIKENIYELSVSTGNGNVPKVLFEVKECIVGDLDTMIQAPPVVSICRQITIEKEGEESDIQSGIQYYYFQNIEELLNGNTHRTIWLTH